MEKGLQEECVEYGVSMLSPQLTQQAFSSTILKKKFVFDFCPKNSLLFICSGKNVCFMLYH